jgi:hypothetical protein
VRQRRDKGLYSLALEVKRASPGFVANHVHDNADDAPEYPRPSRTVRPAA